MLIVETYLAPSRVHGIGLFAANDIPAHAVVWKFKSFIDTVLPPERFLRLCREVDHFTLQHLMNSTYRRNNRYYYLTDNARFINHSTESCNIAFADDHTEIALRDIKRGEELLEDYTLSYDETDFFFSELVNPDPHTYLQGLERREVVA
jgi:hypothetical protein